MSAEAGAGSHREALPPVGPEVPQHSFGHPDLAIRSLGLLVRPSGDLRGRPSVARQAGRDQSFLKLGSMRIVPCHPGGQVFFCRQEVLLSVVALVVGEHEIVPEVGRVP